MFSTKSLCNHAQIFLFFVSNWHFFHVGICPHGFLSFHCVPKWGVWLHLLYILWWSNWRQHQISSQLLLLRLDQLSPSLLSSCQCITALLVLDKPNLHTELQLWPHKGWAEGTTTCFALLATALQCSALQLAPSATRVHCWQTEMKLSPINTSSYRGIYIKTTQEQRLFKI